MASHVQISAAGMRILKLLVGRRPQTINNLIKATGVTRTAVLQQLNELQGAGLVTRHTEKTASRGRPRHLYAATNEALGLVYGESQRLVVPAIWRAIREVGGERLLRQITRRVSRALAAHYNRRIQARAPHERLRELVNLMAEEGALVELTEQDGSLLVYKRSCPFILMHEEHRAICAVDLEMMSKVVGRRIRHLTSRYDGAPCCVLKLTRGGKNGR